MALTRTTAGLLASDDFPNLNAWINSGVWAAVADPTMIAFDPSPIIALSPGTIGSADYEGVREVSILADTTSAWYMVYDGGNGTTAWREFWAVSSDRGLTWTKMGAQSIGLGSYAGTATGWLEKRGGVYYLYRVTATSLYNTDPPAIGLPAGPYGGDIWTATDPNGTWTFLRTFPIGSSLATTQNLPGSVYFDGTTYHLFNECDNGYTARFFASSLAGTWTQDPVLVTSTYDGGASYAENPKVFYHPGLARYCMLANMASSGGNTLQNLMIISSSITDWSAATTRRIQHVCPLDGTNTLGVIEHLKGPDDTPMMDVAGNVAAVYNTDGVRTTPSFHQGRRNKYVVLEPSVACARFTNPASATPFRITNPTTHRDIVAEFACEFRAMDASNGQLIFEFRRQDTANYYALTIRPGSGMTLYKIVAGAQTTLQNPIASGELPALGVVHRVRLVAAGTRIQAWMNGELQIDITDVTYGTGVSVAFTGAKMDGDVRHFSLRTGQTITVNGVGTVVTLRGAGGIPFATAVGPDPVFTVAHSPLSGIDIGGDSYEPFPPLWGGDVYQVTGMGAKSIFG
jgi:hypothetical protein